MGGNRLALLALVTGLFCAFQDPAWAAPPPLSDYGQLPGFEMASISPSGGHIAIVGTAEGSRRLLVFDADKKLIASATVNSAKIRGIQWAGDQAVLVDHSATISLTGFTTNKAELSSVLVVPIDGNKPWEVFGGHDEITGGVSGDYGVIQRGGRWYGYFGGVTFVHSYGGGGYLPDGAVRPDLYEVDLLTHSIHRIAQRSDSEGVDREWLVDANGSVGASLDILHNSGNWTVYNGRHDKLASGTDPLGRVGLVGFTPDGSSVVYAVRDAKAVTDNWFSVPLAGGVPQPYLEKETFQKSFEDRGHRLIGYITDTAAIDGHFFDLRRDKIYRASQKAFPGLRMNLEDADDSFDRLIVTTQGPGDPITWWLVDIHTGKADILGTSYPISSASVGPMRMVSYTAADGLKMEGVLTLPQSGAAKALPAVVLPHGGPTYYDVAGFDWIAQAFASRGYAVFQPNFRGSSGYGTAFELAGNGEWGRKMQTDISDGLAELVKQGIVDPKRVCIVGASYGGYAALAGVTLQQGIYRCAVSYAGLSDLTRFVTDNAYASNADPMLMRNLKLEVGTGRDLRAVSPIRFADKVNVPVLLIHGKDDTVVNISQSTGMVDALRRAGKPVEFVTLPHEDHWLSQGETRLAMLQAAVDFVTKNNPSDPSK